MGMQQLRWLNALTVFQAAAAAVRSATKINSVVLVFQATQRAKQLFAPSILSVAPMDGISSVEIKQLRWLNVPVV